jgi:pyridoxal phosphate enzyme (YggS family)
MTIADNVKRVRDLIAEAAVKSGRSPGEITLVAASKMNTAERVREAILAGVDAVGENRVQEMLDKNSNGAYQGAPLHFIGHLQTNKVKAVVGICQLIESADSAGLLGLIDKRAATLGIKQEILIEVNIGREENKSGVLKENLEELLIYAGALPGISVQGLMAIPPALGGQFNYFDEMYKLFVDIRAKKYDNISMNFLSMGMSDSFTEAIAAGSNMVRVGSAIFGARQY